VDVKYDAELMEWVVREVIRRLTADGRFTARNAAPTTAVAQCKLNVTDRLVTLATLQGKLDGITQVTIARRSVVTPAVRDELKQRMIELRRSE
jgi:DNA-binding FadR family transcriptional regulator